MRFRRFRPLRSVAARLRKRHSTQGLILAYHRIVDAGADPWGLAVSPRHFAEHLDFLHRRHLVLPMTELVRRIGDRTLPQGAVALTFDDGYADNLINAKPLLERYGIPATVFVASGYVGAKAPFWWDRLQRVLLEPGTLPRKLAIAVNGLWYERDLGEDAEYDEGMFARHRTWRVGEPPPTARHEVYRSLWQLLRPLPSPRRCQILDQIGDWSGLRNGHHPNDRTVSQHEVAALARGGLIEIGAHTVTHPLLSALPEPSQEREIADSRTALEDIVGQPVASFAYPYGDHSPATASIVARIGFTAAVTTEGRTVGEQSPRLHLPRMLVDDLNGDRFCERLVERFAA